MEYKKQEDLLKVISVLADLFTNEVRNYHLFASRYIVLLEEYNSPY